MKNLKLLLMILFGSFIIASAQETATLTLTDVGEQTPGTVINVPLTLEAITQNIATFQLYVMYDPAVLTPYSVTGNTGYATNYAAQVPAYAWFNQPQGPGEMLYTFFDFSGMGVIVPAGTVLCELQFTYTEGYTDLTWGLSKGIPGYKEKGMTAMWYVDPSFNTIAYELTLNPGSAGVGVELDNEWTGLAGTSEWDNAGNWSQGIPLATDNVLINNVAKAPFPILTIAATCANLTINPLAVLTVGVGGQLTTTGTVTNLGSFIIASDATGAAGSFIDAGIAAGGTWEFQRIITNSTPYGSEGGWHFISSPLPATEFTSDDLYYYYVNWFNSLTQQYVPIEGSPTLPCTPAPTVNNNMMEGWSIKYDDQYAALCAGTVEDYEINMVGTSFNTGVQSAGFNTGYNLMGNPYPSALDPDFITWPAGLLTNTAYMWDGDATTGGAANWVLAQNGLGNNIPSTQGFFVEATAPGTFQFNGTTGAGGERVHGTAWLKDASDLLALKATVEGISNSDVAYIRFNDVSTVGLDKEWDAKERLAGIAETPQLYTTSAGLELALNTQPETDMVPMSFVCGTAGTYTIEAIETGTFAYVELEDVITGEFTDLLASAYTFSYTNVEQVRSFIVHFAPLGISELSANNVKIWSLENNIIVNVPADVTGEIAVYNMMGQEVVRTDITGVETQISVSDVNTNYVVKVISNSNAVTGKVYVK
jgi:hypothetical protein